MTGIHWVYSRHVFLNNELFELANLCFHIFQLQSLIKIIIILLSCLLRVKNHFFECSFWCVGVAAELLWMTKLLEGWSQTHQSVCYLFSFINIILFVWGSPFSSLLHGCRILGFYRTADEVCGLGDKDLPQWISCVVLKMDPPLQWNCSYTFSSLCDMLMSSFAEYLNQNWWDFFPTLEIDFSLHWGYTEWCLHIYIRIIDGDCGN